MLEKRHGDHHNANIKYGTFLLVISLLVVSYIAVRNLTQPEVRARTKRDLRFPLWLSVLLWTAVVLALGVVHVEELNESAKRFGRLCYALLPLIVFLAIRPSPLPRTFYLTLLPLHKWLGRLATLVGVIHGVLYTVHFIKKNEFYKVFKFDNFLGVIILTVFVVMVITSLPFFRKRMYSLFYTFHYLSAWFVAIATIFHARPGVGWLFFWVALFMGSSLLYRLVASSTVKVESSEAMGPDLHRITFPRSILPEFFVPASHIRVSRTLRNPLTWISSTHPYTISSLPSDDHVELIARPTKFSLAHAAAGTQFSVYGPFESLPDDFFSTANRVLVFAGGAGISYALPVVQTLAKAGISHKLVWVLRNKAGVSEIESRLSETSTDIYITGQDPFQGEGVVYAKDAEGTAGLLSEEMEMEEIGQDDEGRERDELDDLLSEDEGSSSQDSTKGAHKNKGKDQDNGKREAAHSITYHDGRPQPADTASAFFLNRSAPEGKWILACGPNGLVKTAEQAAKKTGVRFCNETYSM